MAIPDYRAIMIPVLRFLSDGAEHHKREVVRAICEEFHLTRSEIETLVPSSRQTLIDNRTGWSLTYLRKAIAIITTRRGFVKITDRGREILSENPDEISVKYLLKYAEFREFRERRKPYKDNKTTIDNLEVDVTPEESIKREYVTLRADLAEKILENVKTLSPKFFEILVVELLMAMGYGGAFENSGRVMGKPGDEGVDGIIEEDKLGLEKIYVQAKRWQGSVGRPVVQEFVGALHGKKARKGVIITTSHFTKEAQDYVEQIENRVVLVDGARLAELMIDHDIGVSTYHVVKLKKIDIDYFSDE